MNSSPRSGRGNLDSFQGGAFHGHGELPLHHPQGSERGLARHTATQSASLPTVLPLIFTIDAQAEPFGVTSCMASLPVWRTFLPANGFHNEALHMKAMTWQQTKEFQGSTSQTHATSCWEVGITPTSLVCWLILFVEKEWAKVSVMTSINAAPKEPYEQVWPCPTIEPAFMTSKKIKSLFSSKHGHERLSSKVSSTRTEQDFAFRFGSLTSRNEWNLLTKKYCILLAFKRKLREVCCPQNGFSAASIASAKARLRLVPSAFLSVWTCWRHVDCTLDSLAFISYQWRHVQWFKKTKS